MKGELTRGDLLGEGRVWVCMQSRDGLKAQRFYGEDGKRDSASGTFNPRESCKQTLKNADCDIKVSFECMLFAV